MNIDKIIRDFDNIISTGFDSVAFPYQKGNSIRIKNIVIRKSAKGYRVFDCETNQLIMTTNFKSTALAVAKNLAEKRNVVDQIKKLDFELLKHYNDILVYRHVIKNSNDLCKTKVRKARLSVSLEKSHAIKEKINDFIFDK